MPASTGTKGTQICVYLTKDLADFVAIQPGTRQGFIRGLLEKAKEEYERLTTYGHESQKWCESCIAAGTPQCSICRQASGLEPTPETPYVEPPPLTTTEPSYCPVDEIPPEEPNYLDNDVSPM